MQNWHLKPAVPHPLPLQLIVGESPHRKPDQNGRPGKLTYLGFLRETAPSFPRLCSAGRRKKSCCCCCCSPAHHCRARPSAAVAAGSVSFARSLARSTGPPFLLAVLPEGGERTAAATTSAQRSKPSGKQAPPRARPRRACVPVHELCRQRERRGARSQAGRQAGRLLLPPPPQGGPLSEAASFRRRKEGWVLKSFKKGSPLETPKIAYIDRSKASSAMGSSSPPP